MAFDRTVRLHPAAGRLAALSMLALAAAAVSVLVPGYAHAQSPDAQVEQLVNKASNDYDNLEIPSAKKKLQRAIDTGEDQGASKAAIAKAYVMLGVVQYGASRKEQEALGPFKKALELDYEAKVPSVYKTPDLTKLMKKARQAVPKPKGDTDDGPAPGPKREVEAFTHEPISSAQAGEPLLVEAFVPTDLTIETVYFVFSRYNQSQWHQIEMKATNATRFAKEVPGYRIYTTQVSYYLEAVDASGNVVARSADRDSPHQFTVLGGSDFDPQKAKQDYLAKQEEETSNETEPSDGEEDATDETDEGDGAPKRSTPVAYIDVGGGTGVGFLPGGTPTANPDRTVSPGFAPAFGHALLGGGYVFPNGAQLGLYMRWQFSPSQNFAQIRSENSNRSYSGFSNGECLGTGIPGDCLLGLKYRWFFSTTPGLRPFASVGGGVGRVRHWLRLKERAEKDFCDGRKVIDGSYCYRRDTVRPGFAHIGVGGGIGYDISSSVAIVGEAYAEVLFPDTAVNIDLNVGPQFRF